MVIISILIGILLLDNICCYVYCRLKKQRSSYKIPKLAPDEVSQPAYLATSGKKHIKRIALNWIESWLRFRLWGISRIPSHHIRDFFYRHVFCADIAKGAVLYYGTEIRAPWNLHIGTGTIIGDNCILDARSGLFIGNNVNFSSGVMIWTLQHDVNSPSFSTSGEDKSVVIGDRAWLSCRSVILPGIVVGEGSVVAAGCVVTKNCDPYGIYGGIPNKLIGKRTAELNYSLGKSYMHFL